MKRLYNGKILGLAFPVMVENILQMLMGFVDHYLVAQISLTAVSGVAIANNVITVYQALFMALGAAISSLLARSMGQGDDEKGMAYMATAVTLTFFLSLMIGFFNLLFGRQLLAGLGAWHQVLEMSYAYLAVVGGMMISLALLTTLGAIVRARGLTKLPMHVSLLTNVLNTIMSVLSIYFLHFGVQGVAWSTVVARLIGVFILASFLPIKKILKNATLKINREVLSLAIPAAAERLMMRLGDLLILMIIVQLGTEVVAGNAIGETISQFNYMPGMAIATASLILVAELLGNQKEEEIAIVIKKAFRLSTAIMITVSVCTFFFSRILIPSFTSDQKAYHAAQLVLFFSLISAPVTSGTLIYTSLWQGLGNAKLPFYATTIGMWVVRIIVGYLLAIQLKLGLEGVWMATALDNLVRYFILKSQYERYKKVLR